MTHSTTLIEKFLIKPLEAIKKGQKFNGEWTAPGPWKRGEKILSIPVT